MIHQYTLIIPGGYNYNNDGDDFYYDDILEYDPEEDTMTIVGHMTQGRAFHAVSVVAAEDYLPWCQWPILKWLFFYLHIFMNKILDEWEH